MRSAGSSSSTVRPRASVSDTGPLAVSVVSSMQACDIACGTSPAGASTAVVPQAVAVRARATTVAATVGSR